MSLFLRGVVWFGIYALLLVLPVTAVIAVDPFGAPRPALIELGVALGLLAFPLVTIQFALVSHLRASSRPFGTESRGAVSPVHGPSRAAAGAGASPAPEPAGPFVGRVEPGRKWEFPGGAPKNSSRRALRASFATRPALVGRAVLNGASIARRGPGGAYEQRLDHGAHASRLPLEPTRVPPLVRHRIGATGDSVGLRAGAGYPSPADGFGVRVLRVLGACGRAGRRDRTTNDATVPA